MHFLDGLLPEALVIIKDYAINTWNYSYDSINALHYFKLCFVLYRYFGRINSQKRDHRIHGDRINVKRR